MSGPRSRSPEYRQNRYSPSRPLSPGQNRYEPRARSPVEDRARREDSYRPDARRPERAEYADERRHGNDERRRLSPARYDRRHDDDLDRREDGRGRRYDNYARDDRWRAYDDDECPPPRRYEYEREREWHDRDWERNDRDRDWERERERERDRRDEGRWERGRNVEELGAPKRGLSEPSKDVIFLGLDPDLTEPELLAYLRREHRVHAESAKIVREKTGASKGFGFVAFITLQDATDFVTSNHPYVSMPSSRGGPATNVRIDFAGTSAPSAAASAGSSTGAHDGIRDIGSPAADSRVLLFRGLSTGTFAQDVMRRTNDEIARLVGKAVGPGGVERVVLIVDKVGAGSWGLAFVELVSPELAAALLPFLLSPQHQPAGFVIASRPIAASYANPTSFQPTPAGPLGGQFLVRAAGNGGIGDAAAEGEADAWVGYWHEQGGAVEVRAPPADPAVRAAFLGTLAGKPSAPLAEQQVTSKPEKLSGAMAPISMGAIKIGLASASAGTTAQSTKRKKDADVMVPLAVKNVLHDEEEEDLVGKDTVLLSRTKGAHVIPPTSTSRKIASNISKWNTKQTELAAPRPTKEARILSANTIGRPSGNAGWSAVNATPGPSSLMVAAAPPPAGPTITTIPPPPVASVPNPPQPAPPAHADAFDYSDTASFANLGKVACLLCQRQFKSEDVLRKHVAQSDLHKTNLANAETCQAGQRRKQAAAAAVAAAASGGYRDRAAERREVFNQPDKPDLAPAPAPSSAAPGPRAATDTRKPPVPPAPVHPAQDAANVGNVLLAKMGWAAGAGLGKDGDGRAAPISVTQFEARAGLGAARGWDPTKGYAERGHDMTRGRYEASSSDKRA
ncbi:hypothetical protein Q5752_005678 [Cryptotrichosporon argae]